MGMAALALLILLHSGLLAVQEDQHEQATALLSRAAELSDIRSPESEPFFLVAGVRLLELTSGEETEGTYTLSWETPDRWRAQFDFRGAYQDVQIVNDGRQWRRSTMDQEPVRVYETRQVLAFVSRLKLMSQETASNIRSRSEDEALTHCVEMGKKSPVALDWPFLGEVPHEFCFDAAAGHLVREKGSHLTNAYMEYAPWGRWLFPRTLRVFEGDTLVVEVRVKGIATNPDADPAWFEPPNGEEWVFGIGADEIVPPELIHQVLPEYTSQATGRGIEGEVLVDATVTTQGNVVRARLVRGLPDMELNRRAMESALQWRFEPGLKDGQPVPVRVLFTFTFRINQDSLPTGSQDIGIVTGSRSWSGWCRRVVSSAVPSLHSSTEAPPSRCLSRASRVA